MDANLFYIFNLVFWTGFLFSAVRSGNEMTKIALPFFVGVMGIILMATVNTDGGLTNPTSAVFPALYIPLFVTLLNFTEAFYNVVKR